MSIDKNNIGIYKITDIESGSVYIGSTSDLKSRIHTHLWQLRSNNHSCTKIQESFNKSGEDAIEFELMQNLEQILTGAETFWINRFNEDEKIECLNKQKVGVLHLGYKLETGKPVRNIDTGEVFRSIAEAHKKYGIKKNDGITVSCNSSNRRCAGYRWEFVNKSDEK